MKNQKTLSHSLVLITGGTGSWGNELTKQLLAKYNPKEIRIYSRGEHKQVEMKRKFKDERLKYYIGDVREKRSLDNAMRGVDYVFHAAALKQVPSCEFFPMEAVSTNVAGCENVLDSAFGNGVKNVVVLSTDKAVYPINAMGMSKALSEKVMIAKSRNLRGSGTVFCGTRYGNVMASRGSVIPLLVDQIKHGAPLTLTDPRMTRFMMTLERAVDLVLFAFEHGENGDLFIQKAPASTIEVLAEALLKLYNASNSVRIIGTRHGEKLYETLVNREEMVKAEDMGDYYRVPADTRDLNYGTYFTEGEEKVAEAEDYTSHNTRRLDVEQTMELLLQLKFIRHDILGEPADND